MVERRVRLLKPGEFTAWWLLNAGRATQLVLKPSTQVRPTASRTVLPAEVRKTQKT